jgi:glutamate-1-semialdehyde 2,1-aminomutase
MKTVRSKDLMHRAEKVIPGGVNSPVRAFRAVGGDPLFIARGKGSSIWDVDGNRYLDYVGSWGPMILGHAEPSVVEAVQTTMERGSSFGAPTEMEVKLAETIHRRVPSIDKVRLVSSGTEATMSAVRLARAFSNREIVVKFEGCYHGHADHFLTKAGSGMATLSLPDSPGVPSSVADLTRNLPYNDIEALDALFAQEGSTIACVIVEPVAGNMGLVLPRRGFLERLRELTTQHGSVLIFDEVMTGFRVHPAGVQGLLGIQPDLTTLGKIIGGGLPLGAFGGRAEIMDLIAPAGPVYQAGTLSGNPCAVAAGLKTLEYLTSVEIYEQLERTCQTLEEGLVSSLRDANLGGRVQRCGSMLTVFFNDGSPVTNFSEARAADHPRFGAFFRALLEQGIYFPPSGFEAAFVSLAHSTDEIERTIEAARSAMQGL